jgi:hypothetical protein
MSAPPPNKYFQTAIANPDTKMSEIDLHVHRDRPTYESPFKFDASQSQPRVIKVTVGADAATQRTWYLPKALLLQKSTFLAQLCTSPFRKEIILEGIDMRAFANFVDYMRSSIYTLNEQIPNFRRIHDGAKACLLGQQLGAISYSNAAISSLHMMFEPLARLKSSNMRMSTIRAEDVGFVCRNTDSTPEQLASGIRRLFFDAVASHWSQWEAKKVSSYQIHHDKDMREWTDLSAKYEDFRIAMLRSCSIPDPRRKELLRDVHEYLDAEIPAVKKDTVNQLGIKRTPLKVISDRAIASPRSLLLSLKRRASSERRRRERAEAGHANMDTQQDENGNEEQGQDAAEAQAATEQDWTMVDAEIKREEQS